MFPITNSGLVLKPFAKEDIPEFVAAVKESAGIWMPWGHKGYSEGDAKKWFESCQRNIAKETAYDIGIFLAKGGDLVGGISINQINRHNNSGNVGYWVRESLRGQGIAVRAVELVTEFGFNNLALTRLEICVLKDNKASRRVAEKSGATFECIAQNRLVHNGKAMAAAVYALVP